MMLRLSAPVSLALSLSLSVSAPSSHGSEWSGVSVASIPTFYIGKLEWVQPICQELFLFVSLQKRTRWLQKGYLVINCYAKSLRWLELLSSSQAISKMSFLNSQSLPHGSACIVTVGLHRLCSAHSHRLPRFCALEHPASFIRAQVTSGWRGLLRHTETTVSMTIQLMVWFVCLSSFP